MEFRDKLGLLLDTFNINSSQLARESEIDVSLISRWRTGNRLPSKRSKHIGVLAEYFTSKAKTEELAQTLMHAIGHTEPLDYKDTEIMKQIIMDWFYMDMVASSTERIESLITNLCAVTEMNLIDTERNYKSSDAIDKLYDLCGADSSFERKIGVDYKLKGFARLLKEAKDSKENTIYFYTNESLDWLTKDVDIYFMVMDAFKYLIAKGFRLVFVHAVRRDLESIAEAIELNIGLYPNRSIELLYYPANYLYTFGYSLFGIEGVGAFSSNSFMNDDKSYVNNYFTKKNELATAIDTLQSIVAHSEPLMRTYEKDQYKDLFEKLHEIESSESNLITISNSCSTTTMVYEDGINLYKLAGLSERAATKFMETRMANFGKSVENNVVTHIFSLIDPEKVARGKVAVPLSGFMPYGPVYYTREYMVRHLENVIRCLELYDNYNVILVNEEGLFDNMSLFIPEVAESLMIKSDVDNPYAYLFNNDIFTESLGVYGTNFSGLRKDIPTNKTIVDRKLRYYLRQIRGV